MTEEASQRGNGMLKQLKTYLPSKNSKIRNSEDPKNHNLLQAEVIEMDSSNASVSDDSIREPDPYNVMTLETPEDETETKWSDMKTTEKIFNVVLSVGKTLTVLFFLYLFVCSLDLLSLGFRLVGGRAAGSIFQNNNILGNPVVGVMIGIITTVLVQSSSTSTSIIVSMVAAGFMDVQQAIPLVMGANIGTSITNTIVSFSQVGDRDQFRRAFACATILDMFNWITVIFLLVIEVLSGYIYHLSGAIMNGLVPDSSSGGTQVQLLSTLTKPFVNLIVQLNSTVLECWSTPNCTFADNATLLKTYCSNENIQISVSQYVTDKQGNVLFDESQVLDQLTPIRCKFIFADTSLSDSAVGAIVLVCSLIVLCVCLVFIVKVLNSILKGKMSQIIRKTLNSDIPWCPPLTGYIAILVGTVMTFLVQSSSVFTSALTPLVGMGVISLERVYPLTLGSNIGTTTTAIIAAMAVEGDSFKPSMQIALCHFIFNVTGILLFYPLPFLRFPIKMARFLGDTTAEYRWFAVLYMIFMFCLLPILIIGLSFAGSIYVIVFVSIVGLTLAVVVIINIVQNKKPEWLPTVLQTWDWLPEPMRSLRPYNSIFSVCLCCKGAREGHEAAQKENKRQEPTESQQGVDNEKEDVRVRMEAQDGSMSGIENPTVGQLTDVEFNASSEQRQI